MKNKCIVMFSGGLDSRLVIKIMQEKKFEILALFFKLPFGTGCCDEGCSFNFSQLNGVKLKIFDCTKGKLLQEYLEVIKRAKHGRGAGINPCIDCKIFMFKKAKEYAHKNGIKIIATGEVLGQRPMSQNAGAMKIIDKEVGFELTRPLIELGISGRRRQKQMALAKKFKINFPHPAGGCILCEKELKKRLIYLLKRGLNEQEVQLVRGGRHFVIDGSWVILGKDEGENEIIERIGKKEGTLIIPDYPAPTAIILDKSGKTMIKKINELIKAYSKKGNLDDRKKFEKYNF